MRLAFPALACALAVAAGPTLAAPACAAPANLAPAPAVTPRPDEVVSGVTVAYYVLALNWTPEWRRSGGSGATASQMDGGQDFGFTLHGLWPDGARPPYPRFCRSAGALDPATVRRMYCRTPSPTLLQHEWQAHGTCAGWSSAEAYFAQASKLFDRIVLPKIEAIPADDLTAGAVRAAFVAKNPGLRPQGVFVQTVHGADLGEVRLCYDLQFRPIACPGSAGAPDGVRLRLAPSRSGAF
jgi:ribonuclease T2